MIFFITKQNEKIDKFDICGNPEILPHFLQRYIFKKLPYRTFYIFGQVFSFSGFIIIIYLIYFLFYFSKRKKYYNILLKKKYWRYNRRGRPVIQTRYNRRAAARDSLKIQQKGRRPARDSDKTQQIIKLHGGAQNYLKNKFKTT